MKSILVYADESGTQDLRGVQSGSEFPTIAGFAAPPSEWDSFKTNWAAVLKAYSVPYFHFSEWASASAAIRYNRPETSSLRKNPFYNSLKLQQLDKMLLSLAKIAGQGNKVAVAGTIKLEVWHRFKAKLEVENPEQIELEDNPYKFCMSEFFKVCHRELFYRWGGFQCQVHFVFDKNDNPEWTRALWEVFTAYQGAEPRFASLDFGDDRIELPLQAADMMAYRLNQCSRNLVVNKLVLKELDERLLASLYKNAAVANLALAPFIRK